MVKLVKSENHDLRFKGNSFHLWNVNSLDQPMICVNFCFIMTSSFEKIDMYFHFFCFSLSLKKLGFLCKQSWFHFAQLQRCIVSSVYESYPVVLKKRYSNSWRSIVIVLIIVIWLKYCRYGVKHHPIYQIIVVNVFVTICLSSPISNQEAHAPFCSAEKQLKSINTFLQSYAYIITLI